MRAAKSTGLSAAILLIREDVTESEIAQIVGDYQGSRAPFNEALESWYAYVERLASSEGVRLTFN
jgi:hypothetical protein